MNGMQEAMNTLDNAGGSIKSSQQSTASLFAPVSRTEPAALSISTSDKPHTIIQTTEGGISLVEMYESRKRRMAAEFRFYRPELIIGM